MHWAPLASKEGGPGGGLCVKHKVNSTTIQQLLLAPDLLYCTLSNLTVLPIFCILLDTANAFASPRLVFPHSKSLHE